jgi:Fic family protein
MDARAFVDTTYGVVTLDRIGSWPHGYYLPGPIPRSLDLDDATDIAVARADKALNFLAGMSAMLPSPDVLLAQSLTSEALSSSRIEGTQASLSDVVVASSNHADIASEDVREVINYREALLEGVRLLQTLPLTQRLFCDVHRVLMTGVRGQEKTPGEIRRSPVWVGGVSSTPEGATYIPPVPEKIPELLSDWENFVNTPGPGGSSVVVRQALAHYQFETIHPFLDGNGRVGRVLIVLMMITDGVFQRPLMGMSSFFERHKSEYYDRLQAVREKGNMAGWVTFFAGAVYDEATRQAQRLQALVAIRESYLDQAKSLRPAMGKLVDVLLETPVVSVPQVQVALGVSRPTAVKIVREAENLGWLVSLGRKGLGGLQRWYAKDFWDITTDESPGFSVNG